MTIKNPCVLINIERVQISLLVIVRLGTKHALSNPKCGASRFMTNPKLIKKILNIDRILEIIIRILEFISSTELSSVCKEYPGKSYYIRAFNHNYNIM